MNDEQAMQAGVKEAQQGKSEGNLPFGAVVVQDHDIIARAHATDKSDGDVTAHAELQAVRQACKKTKSNDLSACTIYTTSEPCLMCASAIFYARISRVVIGASRDDIAQFFRPRKLRINDLIADAGYPVIIEWGVQREEIIKLLSDVLNQNLNVNH